jgi:hypothetical protein
MSAVVSRFPDVVTPAEAGVHQINETFPMDPGLRRDDGVPKLIVITDITVFSHAIGRVGID